MIIWFFITQMQLNVTFFKNSSSFTKTDADI